MCKNLRFITVGITDSETPQLRPEIETIIRNAHIFSGGKRHYNIVRALLPYNHIWIEITTPLESVFREYEKADTTIVVFASGDPLFFGYAATLRRRFPQTAVEVYPTFNSLQTLAHRTAFPYQDMRCISLTGRSYHEFFKALISGETTIGVLTDKIRTPRAIASKMLEYGYTNYSITIGENLGNEKYERITTLSVNDTATTDFATLNCMILHRTSFRPKPFGIPDSFFHHLPGRERMITKMPVRLLALSMLEIHNRTSLWDIGFCTGSVSVEAKMQAPHLQITAFEVRPESEALIQLNTRKLGTPGINAVIGDFLTKDLSEYPAPDAVFIGGHGGKLQEMITKIDSVLLPGGVIVFNSVSQDSLDKFRSGIKHTGRIITAEHTIHLDSFNPITVIQAK